MVLLLREPEVPVTVTVVLLMVVVEEALSVRTEVTLPLAGGVTGLVLNDAVTPLGRPVTLSVVAELNPLWLVMVMVVVALPPLGTIKEAGAALMRNAGFTVRATVVVAVRVPEVPVMVTVAVPVVAEPLAVRVRTLVPVVVAGLKEAVTPFGRPDAARLTLPVNPLIGFTVMVVVAADAPWVMVKLLGESDRVKLAAEKASIRPCPFGLPHPVTKS